MTPKLPPAQAGAPVQHLACFCTSISSQGLAPLFGGCECLWGQTPRCPQRSPRALRKGTSFPVFVIILGSKFSSFVLFFPTVVALTASSPSEVWDPPTHPRRGGTKPSFNQSGAAGEGGGGCFPNPFGEGSFFPPPITSAASPSGTRMSRRSLVPAVTLQPRRPEGCARLQGQSQDPTSGDQTSASHPGGGGKDPPSALPSSLRPKLLNPVGARAGASLLPMDGLRSGRDRLPRQTPRGFSFLPTSYQLWGSIQNFWQSHSAGRPLGRSSRPAAPPPQLSPQPTKEAPFSHGWCGRAKPNRCPREGPVTPALPPPSALPGSLPSPACKAAHPTASTLAWLLSKEPH